MTRTQRRLATLAWLTLLASSAAFAACASDELARGREVSDSPESGLPEPSTTPTSTTPPAETFEPPDSALPEPTLQLSAHNAYATCVVRADRAVTCWGFGEQPGAVLGRSITGRFDAVPTEIPGYRASAVSLNLPVGCGVTDGKVSCWGNTTAPPLCAVNGIAPGSDGGPAPDSGSPVPVRIEGAGHVVATGMGGCALTGEEVRCWGDGSSGILGAHDAGAACTPPAGVAFSGARAIDSFYRGVCALKTDGTVWCWGLSEGAGELGRQLDAGPDAAGELPRGAASAPKRIAGLSGVRSLSTGFVHACALTEDGKVWCWGLNSGSDARSVGGQLGHRGGRTCSYGRCDSDPRLVEGLSNVRELSAGAFHTCAVKMDDTVVCWGESSAYALLGHDPRAERDAAPDAQVTGTVAVVTPTSVVNLANVAHVSSGILHTCAVTRDNRVYCWGDNGFGQLGPGARTGGADGGPLAASFTPIEVRIP